jgi:NUMOD3 motif
MFCTYAHYTPQGRLFYIGKGSNPRRAYNFNNRNKYWGNIAKKYGKPKVQILAKWDTEEEAFSHEVLLISCFRGMGYELANLTNGGEGTSGIKLSDEHKAKISLKLKGKEGKKPSVETLKKLKESHLGQNPWNKGKKGLIKKSPETIEKIVKRMLGHKFNVKYKYIGINKETKETIELIGNIAMKKAGFDQAKIGACANGKRKSHKGYIWQKELIKEKAL